MYQDYKDLLSAFHARGVRYLIVGAYAVDFDAAWERRAQGVIDATTGLKANFISAADLITAKLAAGRPQDLADADAIRKAAENQRPETKKELPE